jgi:hypothetical protein
MPSRRRSPACGWLPTTSSSLVAVELLHGRVGVELLPIWHGKEAGREGGVAPGRKRGTDGGWEGVREGA